MRTSGFRASFANDKLKQKLQTQVAEALQVMAVLYRMLPKERDPDLKFLSQILIKLSQFYKHHCVYRPFLHYL